MSGEQTPPAPVVVLDHPLVQHKLTRLRQATTSTAGFRRLTREISLLMAYEATRDLKLEAVEIETPLERMEGHLLSGKKLCLVSILRAGNGILDGMLDLLPAARVGHIGLFRDHATLEPVEYYMKLPDDIGERVCIVVDPMLATGHSAAAAIDRLKGAGARHVVFVCLLAAPEGVAFLSRAHPDVKIITCAIDRGLDDHGYIRPGLGDAGDRLFGTK
ncbi:uracil phosphoribosyltransferase [Gluconacetobacter diazotrophicus PA1 5]|uniref:Uracil phosphoribosyltransferase n=2 Tax=Gluconacetobacter diazotrophicus TaxID=33996 RepID=A9H391_GLUDA|nr:uracil phosphoribosyltransferase [Gluconacetobacter diazotrophicus]ACI52755.1 uracil phosphoribosyltransferase [Gluconacetobacter diazotrophicus PA1 5]MBB2155503.1 uracil phosphoribosyltransferase [Gluconacetobacter diazotrophicus]TWB06121.1 uracil phosphoribosyltransferase [Gluconacetobacter diazotrophicus]CAP57288.1 Uracil phosphoribosyltransferase [Gluconacetobacter diazotrophicus PA1 5]